ncbi:hypothetical protein D3C87_1882470 [compost metagenome]
MVIVLVVLPLHLLLALQRKNAVVDGKLDILLAQPRQFRRHRDRRIAFRDVDRRRHELAERTAVAGAAFAEEGFKRLVHFLAQLGKGMVGPETGKRT